MPNAVLVVDDSAFMRRMICNTLTQCGIHPIVEASDGEEAVDKFIQFLPSLVLMDINMPKKNGIEAAREILSIRSDSIIIMITAVDQDWAKEEAKCIGIQQFITKPFRREELVKVVSGALFYRK